MRGCWNLQEHELVFWKAYVETKINYLIENKDRIDDVDFSQENISPYQLYNVLEALGYDRNNWDSNGWEQDTWATYENPEKDIEVSIYSCGMTFELKLGLIRVGDWEA